MIRLTEKIKRLYILLFRKIWVRIALASLATFLIPTVILLSSLAVSSHKTTSRILASNQQLQSQRLADKLNSFITNSQELLINTAAMLSGVYPSPAKQESMLTEMVLNQPAFMHISSVDSSGKELANSSHQRGLSWNLPLDGVESALKGMVYVSKLKFINKDVPFVTLAAPLRKTGKIVGAIIAEVDLSFATKALLDKEDGKQNKLFLVSEDMPSKQNLPGGNVVSTKIPIPSIGAAIVLNQSEASNQTFLHFHRKLIFIIVLVLFLAIILSVFLARILARPIELLAHEVRNLASGNLKQKMNTKRHDEIGTFAKSLNALALSFQKSQTNARLVAIGESTAWVSHEFKNSLFSIKSLVELLPKRHTDKKFIETLSRLIPLEIKHCEKILNDLSDFSNHRKLRLANTNATEIIKNILEIMNGEFIKKNITVNFNASQDGFVCYADPGRLKQVFVNLFINALESMSKGGVLSVVLRRIASEGSSQASFLEIAITNSGAVISQETLEKIFDPFHTTRSGNMGLGLTIARSIIEQHGGNIAVESDVLTGTCFTTRLPIKPFSASYEITGK